MNKIIKYIYIFFISIFLFGCASDGWYAQQAREKFIRLSLEERELERERRREKCVYLGFVCEDPPAPEPTPEEQERLKNKDSLKYKIRSWYYGVW